MIVVFGSVNVDVVMRLERLPRPGETVLGGRYLLVQGGKGANQACAAARAVPGRGTRVAFVGRVGRDSWGEFALQRLAEAGVDVAGVLPGNEPTGCASITVDRAGENAIAVASGANLEACAEQVADSLLGPATWVLLQMEVPPEENWRLLDRAKARGARVALNLAPAAALPPAALDRLDLLVVNEIEARAVEESLGLARQEPAALARRLAERHGVTCIVTLGAGGALAWAPGGGWAVAPLPVEPLDTTGAGDAFLGAMTAAFDGGAELPAALCQGSVAAGLSCTVAGAQSSFPWAEAIAARLDEVTARPLS